MPVGNLPNTAKVWEAVKVDVRHRARALVKSRKTDVLENHCGVGDTVALSGAAAPVVSQPEIPSRRRP